MICSTNLSLKLKRRVLAPKESLHQSRASGRTVSHFVKHCTHLIWFKHFICVNLLHKCRQVEAVV